MAHRRCISSVVFCSDEYLDLSMSAQVLYPQLMLAADDDGFVSNAKAVARQIVRGVKALEELEQKNYLIKIENVYVIAHWRIQNQWRGDRLKKLNYPDIASRIWIAVDETYQLHDSNNAKNLAEMKNNVVNRNSKCGEIEKWKNESFELLYEMYPDAKKGKKSEAFSAYCDEINDTEAATLASETLRWWCKSNNWICESGKYIPYFKNWMKNGNWRIFPEEKSDSNPEGYSEEVLDEVAKFMAETGNAT